MCICRTHVTLISRYPDVGKVAQKNSQKAKSIPYIIVNAIDFMGWEMWYRDSTNTKQKITHMSGLLNDACIMNVESED